MATVQNYKSELDPKTLAFLLNHGWTHIAIATVYKLPESTISKLIKRYRLIRTVTYSLPENTLLDWVEVEQSQKL